jgi:hypothetical protein
MVGATVVAVKADDTVHMRFRDGRENKAVQRADVELLS